VKTAKALAKNGSIEKNEAKVVTRGFSQYLEVVLTSKTVPGSDSSLEVEGQQV